MHLLRLLLSCRDLLRTGRLRIDASEHRDRLLAVKRGELGWDEIRAWTRTLHEEIDAATDRTPLPPDPDRTRVEDFLIRVRGASAAPALPPLVPDTAELP
jgi:hypothetical protein